MKNGCVFYKFKNPETQKKKPEKNQKKNLKTQKINQLARYHILHQLIQHQLIDQTHQTRPPQ